MKKYILFIVFALGFFTANAQEFEETTTYIAQREIATKQQKSRVTQIQILAAESLEKVATVTISDSDDFDALRISVLDSPALKDIHEIIKVELEYQAYSVAIDTYYFLATIKGDYIALPKVTKVYDDILQPTEDYIFPTQKYGQVETIIIAKYKYTENYKIEGIEVVKSYAWNDDDFDREDAVTANQ